jgi:hypothetical protein
MFYLDSHRFVAARDDQINAFIIGAADVTDLALTTWNWATRRSRVN